jgi:hypothetical protein
MMMCRRSGLSRAVSGCYNTPEMGSTAGVPLPAVVDETLRAYVAGLRQRFG